jgi:hypothetical protein
VPYRDKVLAGQKPTPPIMGTKFGKMLVAGGKLAALEVAAAPCPFRPRAGLFLSWELYSGFRVGRLSPQQFADRCRDFGVGRVAVQLDGYEGTQNGPMFADLKARLHQYGVACGAWEARPRVGSAAALHDAYGLDFYIAEWEVWPQGSSPSDPRVAVDVLDALPTGRIGCAIATNFNPFDWPAPTPENPDGLPWGGRVASKVREKRLACLGEAYLPENRQAWPHNLYDYASRVLKVAQDFQPVIGVYEHPNTGNVHWGVQDYSSQVPAYEQFWVWLPNYMSEADWSEMRRLSLLP